MLASFNSACSESFSRDQLNRWDSNGAIFVGGGAVVTWAMMTCNFIIIKCSKIKINVFWKMLNSHSVVAHKVVKDK